MMIPLHKLLRIRVDFDVNIDTFNARFIGLLSAVERVRGLAGLLYDIMMAFVYPLQRILGR